MNQSNNDAFNQAMAAAETDKKAAKDAGVLVNESEAQQEARQEAFTAPQTKDETIAQDEAQPEAQPEPEAEIPVFDIQQELFRLDGAPSEAQIEAWKAQYRDIFTLPLSPTEMFIYRPMSRLEYRNFNSQDHLVRDDHAMQEAIVRSCVLWPLQAPEHMAGDKAGIVPALHDAIMMCSYFFNPQFLANLVHKL